MMKWNMVLVQRKDGDYMGWLDRWKSKGKIGRKITSRTVAEYEPDSTDYNVTAKSFSGKVRSFMNFIRDTVQPRSEETGSYVLNRRDPWQLERQVMKDPLLFSNISLYQISVREMIGIDRFHFDKPKTEERFKKEIWPAERTNFQRTFLQMDPMHLGIYGNHITEVLYPDAKSINNMMADDFITMDLREYEFIEEKGFVKQKRGVPFGFASKRNRNAVESQFEEGVTCIWGRMNQLHNLEMGWGWVELLFRHVDQLDAVTDARTQKNFRQGYPSPIVTYGNERNPSSNRKKKEAKKIAKQFVDPDSVAVIMPDYMKVDFLDNKLPSNINSQMLEDEMSMRKIEAAVLGIPVAVYLMTMEKQGSSGIDSLAEFFELRLKSFSKDLRMEKAIELSSGPNPGNFWIDYDNILTALKKEKIMQIFRLAKGEILYGNNEKQNEAIRQSILRMVGIQTEDEFFDKVEQTTKLMKAIEDMAEV